MVTMRLSGTVTKIWRLKCWTNGHKNGNKGGRKETEKELGGKRESK